MSKSSLLFVYDLEDENNWKDGLWAAIRLLEKDFQITRLNLALTEVDPPFPDSDWNVDFMLGWGGFNSKVDNWLSRSPFKKGLCLGGYAPFNGHNYDVIFYETEWSKKWLEEQGVANRLVHAFGINSSIFCEILTKNKTLLFNYITVGAFSNWKRQEKLLDKSGIRIAIGQIQKNNLNESLQIIGDLLFGGVAVSDTISPRMLAEYYRASYACYIPAEVMGGGERAVLEARACGTPVIVEDDNPKLKELLESPIWDEKYYASQLKKGINEVLNENKA